MIASLLTKTNPNPGRYETIAPFVRVSVGDGDKFQSGDGFLRAATLTLSEGANASNCRFEIYDPARRYAEKYFSYIFAEGGLTALTPAQPTRSGDSPQTASTSSTADGNLSPQVRAMLDTIAWAEGANYNTLFGGGTFSDFSRHPNRVIRRSGFASTAAGRYQFLKDTWDGLNLTDFTPANQDRGCVLLLRRRGALAAIEAGDIPRALQSISYEWASLPPYRYSGQGTKTTEQVVSYWRSRLAFYQRGGEASEAASESIATASAPPVEAPPTATTNVGSQITVEMGFNGRTLIASSFLHTSLEYSVFDPDILVFGGQAATWVMTQRVRNSAFVNLTFKQVATRICRQYGLTLEMPVDGPKYEYFPQRGQTDYESLMIEARRIGMRVYCRGAKMTIKPRSPFNSGFILEYGDNMGMLFKVRHQAQADQSGGARSSTPGETATTGQRKIALDPGSGVQRAIRPENPVGDLTGENQATTGNDVEEMAPLTDGATDTQDSARRETEARYKGIIAEFQFPATPEGLTLDPDTAFFTKSLTQFLDRAWVIESITHAYSVSSGLITSGSCYTPLKASTPLPTEAVTEGETPPLNPTGFIRPCAGPVTSGFRTARRPRHQGVDLGAPEGTPIYASADGIVTDALNRCVLGDRACGGRYGNRVFIRHGNGYETRYAHMRRGSVTVSAGQQVKQGEKIGEVSNTGDSRGNHLHFEIRQGGTPVNPASLIRF
jgi:murein DD-endopeptidase MepM/ murein hydrolase activator NlpD/muramidase (phage lysozyme)